MLAFTSCMDTSTIVDSNVELDNQKWTYSNKIKIPISINDPKVEYNIYLNLRITSTYKYSNIFLLIHTVTPDGKRLAERREFVLAEADGEWLGSGSGNMFSYQIPFKKNYRFPVKGNYTIELEQNMRDSPLIDISDVGIMVEKSN